MNRWLSGLLPVVLAACLWGGDDRERLLVDDPDVLGFAARIEGFYRALEGIPIDVMMVYEDLELRAHFQDPASFTDYYASLAGQLREAHFRNTRADRVEIRGFRFDGPEQATVELALIGRHIRLLRFWEIEQLRTDTWLLLDGAWILTAEKL